MDRFQCFGACPVLPDKALGLDAYEEDLSNGTASFYACPSCGVSTFPRPARCACGGTDFEPVRMGEECTLYSYTTVYAAPGALERQAPYHVGLVDFPTGERLLLRLFLAPDETPSTGANMKPIVVDYEDCSILAATGAEAPLHEIFPPIGERPMTSRPDTSLALVARKGRDNSYSVKFETLKLSELPDGDVLIRVEYSGLNYKDALAITAKGPIIREFPMVLGIDLAGTVVDSRSSKFQPGDRVVVNGFGMSETRWGGYSQYQSLPERCVTKLPDRVSTQQAMQIGTAGYTAMLCVAALTDHGLIAGKDPVVVSGSTGGVGSIAISLLSRLGFDVIAVTGRSEHTDFLKELGARDIIGRESLEIGERTLGRERWSGAVDVAGGDTLGQLIAQTKYDGIVACCGMAGSDRVSTSVFPFILRGVTLRGVDSVYVDQARRDAAWSMLDQLMDRDLLSRLTQTFDFRDLEQKAHDLLSGKIRGRVVVRMPECKSQ